MPEEEARHVYVFAEESDAGSAYFKVGKATQDGRWNIARLENVARRHGCAQSCTASPLVSLAVIEYPTKRAAINAEGDFAAAHRRDFGVRAYPQHEWYRGYDHGPRGLSWDQVHRWLSERGGVDQSARYLRIHGKYQRGAWEQDLGIGGRALLAPLRVHLIAYADGETSYIRMCASKYPWRQANGAHRHGRVHRDYNTGNWRPVRYLLRAEPIENGPADLARINEGALEVMKQAWSEFGSRQARVSMLPTQPLHSLAWFSADEATIIAWLVDVLNRVWPDGWADTSKSA